MVRHDDSCLPIWKCVKRLVRGRRWREMFRHLLYVLSKLVVVLRIDRLNRRLVERSNVYILNFAYLLHPGCFPFHLFCRYRRTPFVASGPGPFTSNLRNNELTTDFSRKLSFQKSVEHHRPGFPNNCGQFDRRSAPLGDRDVPTPRLS